ncbi:MAG: biopolymer transporter ExbD [Deltaproteobacteria bacterium]|nr:biopolymer transporter ExbD [Deltaproteobacteria bacterium]
MINVRARLRRERKPAQVDMAPMLDMVFILLIFFLVTTSFVRESGVEVQRPAALTAEETRQSGLRLGINAAGQIFVDGQKIDLRSLRAVSERFLAQNPEGSIVVVADEKVTTGLMVKVLDQCRLAGAQRLAVAAEVPSRR